MLEQIKCPYCGCRMMMMTHRDQFECPHCGARGPDCNDEEEARAQTRAKMNVYETLSDAVRVIVKMNKMCDDLMDDLQDADRIECSHCAAYENAATKERCEDADYLCDKCTRTDCPCRTCRDCSNWTWRGVREDAEADLR